MACDWQASLGGQDVRRAIAHLAEQYGNVMSLLFGSGCATCVLHRPKVCAELCEMSGSLHFYVCPIATREERMFVQGCKYISELDTTVYGLQPRPRTSRSWS
jgi:hypothetical protein